MSEPSQVDLAQALAPLLSREEFHAAYAVQWVAHSYGAYGADGMSPEDREETFDFLGTALAFGIRRLHEAGHRFPGIRIDDDSGELFPEAGAEVTPGNIMYVHQLAVGRALDFLLFIQSAITFVEQRELDLDLGPLRHAQQEIRDMLEQTRKEMPPEVAKEIVETRRSVLRTGEHFSRGGGVDVRKHRN